MMPTEEYTGVAVAPEDEGKKVERPKFQQTEEQHERAKYVSWRLSLMKAEKDKYIASKRRALMLYDGVHRLSGDPSGAVEKNEIVSQLAREFVEAKTAIEVRALSEFQFFPVDDANDAWRAELMTEVVEHVRRVTKSRSKRHERIRMKNIIGSSVIWKGFRSTSVKMNVTKEIDDDANPIAWEEKEVPGQDEIFEEVVDLLRDFLIDPNCTTIDDALDAGLYFRMNHEEGQEVFGEEMFDFEGIEAGSDGMIEGVMYFKKPSGKADMFCIYAWPSAGYGVEGMKPGFAKEVYYGGLPDEHKMLPFVSYHNVPSFYQGSFDGTVARSGSGEAATSSGAVNARQKFWAYKGDPEIIMDEVELDTYFMRSLYKACDLASRSIVATDGNKRFDNTTDWQHGDQAVGMKGKYEVTTMGVANLAAFSEVIERVYLRCVRVLGVDPRNIADSKQKTATESISQKETEMMRIEQIIAFNEENGELRDGEITFKLIEQRYKEPKIIRLTGAETKEELAKFDDVEGEHPRTGQPLIGKMYRRIRTKRRYTETGEGESRTLQEDDAGVNSFIAWPEYIRTSQMDIAVVSTRRAGEIRALAVAQTSEGLATYTQLLPLTAPGPTGAPALLGEDTKQKIIDAIECLIDKNMEAQGIEGKQRVKGGNEEKLKDIKNIVAQRRTQVKAVAPVPIPQPTV